jgi:hypothetical protein
MRRYLTPGQHAHVWVSSGRWGPRRVRDTECWAILRAEDVYTDLLRRSLNKLTIGGQLRGSLEWTLPRSGGARADTVDWEIRPNAVWRYGRVFLKCPRCSRTCTRLYVPTEAAWPACRRCWGLTYRSTQERNYELNRGRSRYGQLFSPMVYAMCRADDARVERAAGAQKRSVERRQILARQDALGTGVPLNALLGVSNHGPARPKAKSARPSTTDSRSRRKGRRLTAARARPGPFEHLLGS